MAAGIERITIGQKIKIKFDELNDILYDFIAYPEKTMIEKNITDFYLKLYQKITYPYLSVKKPDKKTYPEIFNSLMDETIKDFILAGGYETLHTFKKRYEMVEISGFYTSPPEDYIKDGVSNVFTIFNNSKDRQFISGKLNQIHLIYMINDTKISPPLKIIKGYECASSSWDIISNFIYMCLPDEINKDFNRCPNKNFLDFFESQINTVFMEMKDVEISDYVIRNKLWKTYPFIYDILKGFNTTMWNRYLDDKDTLPSTSDEDPSNP
jgi:hypothetical protein